MIGFEYICKLQGIQYKEIAELIGKSKQTVNSWTSGARKIPKKYLPILSQRFKIPEVYIQKELSKIEELEIQKMRLENESVGIEYEYTEFNQSTENKELIKFMYFNKGIADSIAHTEHETEVESLVEGIKETINKSFSEGSNTVYEALNDASELLDLYKMFTAIVADEKVNKEILGKLLLATKCNYQGCSTEDELVLNMAKTIKELDEEIIERNTDADDGLFE